MICTTIQNKELPEILKALEGLEMAEIRLDRCALEDEEIETLFQGSDIPLVATCRMAEEPDAPRLLELAIMSGAKYADLEMEAPAAVGRRIREACRNYGTVLIRSYHNFENTPSRELLRSLALIDLPVDIRRHILEIVFLFITAERKDLPVDRYGYICFLCHCLILPVTHNLTLRSYFFYMIN